MYFVQVWANPPKSMFDSSRASTLPEERFRLSFFFVWFLSDTPRKSIRTVSLRAARERIYPRAELRVRGSRRQLTSGAPEAVGGPLFPGSWPLSRNNFENIDSRTDNAFFSI